MSSLNTPYGTVPEKLLAVLFKEHPYRWTPIGQIPHLRAATIDELQAFWDQYYVPANATLVVVGDLALEPAGEAGAPQQEEGGEDAGEGEAGGGADRALEGGLGRDALVEVAHGRPVSRGKQR
jgi:hypothetical protein